MTGGHRNDGNSSRCSMATRAVEISASEQEQGVLVRDVELHCTAAGIDRHDDDRAA